MNFKRRGFILTYHEIWWLDRHGERTIEDVIFDKNQQKYVEMVGKNKTVRIVYIGT